MKKRGTYYNSLLFFSLFKIKIVKRIQDNATVMSMIRRIHISGIITILGVITFSGVIILVGVIIIGKIIINWGFTIIGEFKLKDASLRHHLVKSIVQWRTQMERKMIVIWVKLPIRQYPHSHGPHSGHNYQICQKPE